MELKEFVTSLESLAVLAEQAFADAKSNDDFEAARVQFVGARSGQMKAIQKELGSVPSESRRDAGMKLNEVKNRIQSAPRCRSRTSKLERFSQTKRADSRSNVAW